jgi:hypothetical protein
MSGSVMLTLLKAAVKLKPIKMNNEPNAMADAGETVRPALSDQMEIDGHALYGREILMLIRHIQTNKQR